MSQIIWIALPNRIEGGSLYVSVFVAPRLSVDKLTGTPFENWPATVSLVDGLDVTFSGAYNGKVNMKVANPTLDGSLWKSLFEGTPVKPFQFKDNSARNIWSFGVADLMNKIDALYHQVAQTSPTAPPTLDLDQAGDPFAATLLRWNAANAKRIDVRNQRYSDQAIKATGWDQATKNELADLAASGLNPEQQNFWRARRFFDRPSPRKDKKGGLKDLPALLRPQFDFHEKVALLGDHPFILRRLGLVLDLVAPVPVGFAGPGFVSLSGMSSLRTGIGINATGVMPRTAYEATAGRFGAAPAPGSADAAGGMLPLDSAAYAVVQGEPNGDAHKVTDFASNMVKLVANLDSDVQRAGLAPKAALTQQALPARRTTGFLLTRVGRGQAMAARFARNLQVNQSVEQNAPEDLYAEDVTRGLRVDVLGGSGQWRSLLRRRVTYSFGTTNPALIAANVADEAYVKAGSATSDPDANGPSDLYLHEGLVGWEGWSLSVARPGRVVGNDYSTDEETLSAPNTAPSADFPLEARAKVEPGSLEKLRFGQAYQFRARLVDLAGNSLPFDSSVAAATPHASAPQIYKRYEPLPPPTIVLRNVVTEGESVEHLVIRSGDGTDKTPRDPDAYAKWLNSNYADAAFPEKTYLAYCDRHVAPPKSTQERAEAHGAFDGAFQAGADRKKYFRLATREEGTFADKRIVDLNVDADANGNGYITGNPNGATIVTPPQVPHHLRRATNGGPDTSSLTEHRGDALAPGEYVICAADKVVLPYLPEVAAAGAAFFTGGGADVFPLAQTSWTGTWPELTCYRLRLSGGTGFDIDGASADQKEIKLGPAEMRTIHYSTAPKPSLLPHFKYWLDDSQLATVATGRHWMITPARKLVLVHAVQRPLAPPAATLKLDRNYGDTFVAHTGSIACHGKSTGHVDVLAQWFEVEDRITRPLPNDVIGDATRPATLQSGSAYQLAVDYGAASVAVPDVKHEFGDTKHRLVAYRPVGTTRFREYFPAALIADTANLTVDGTAVSPRPDGLFSVKSSARPAPPKIVYVVPTFKWEVSPDGKKSTRKGGGLRVYLERPWYSSGRGEQIAVLLPHPTMVGVVPDDALAAASRWGRDPVWNSKANGVLTAAQVLNAKSVEPLLALAETDSVKVDAAVFDVEYNAERRLWFFDIELNVGAAYFPFVSLALARYQRESLPGIELSPMARAEFAQLTADRTVTVTVQPLFCTVSVKGVVADNAWGKLQPQPAPAPPPRGVAPTVPTPTSHKFVAYAQERTPGSSGELGWTRLTNDFELAGQMTLNSSTGQWSGVVNLPPALNPPRERRLVIEEREFHEIDPLVAQAGDVTYAVTAGYRVVYIDTVSIFAAASASVAVDG